jgi:hypothetical protein
MGFIPRVVDQLSMVKESLAFHNVGNSVPVEALGAILGKMVAMWARTPRAEIEVCEAERATKEDRSGQWIGADSQHAQTERPWYPGAALESSAVNKGKKGK